MHHSTTFLQLSDHSVDPCAWLSAFPNTEVTEHLCLVSCLAMGVLHVLQRYRRILVTPS